MTILDELAGYAKERVAQAERRIPRETLRRMAEALPRGGFCLRTGALHPGYRLYLRMQEGVALQRADRAGFSVS